MIEGVEQSAPFYTRWWQYEIHSKQSRMGISASKFK